MCSSVEGVQECSRINKIKDKDPLALFSTLRLADSSFTEDQNETVLHLLKIHFPDGGTDAFYVED